MSKIAMITGATSGIGLATARAFADSGFDMIITGRRGERLEEIKNELSQKVDVLALNFDVKNREEVVKVIQGIDEKFQNIDVLVNNAGNAYGLDPIHESNLDHVDLMVDINLKGLIYVTHEVSLNIVKRRKGHIINVGSIAAKETYAKGNVYSATKHAVDAFTKGIRIDLNPYGIKVGAIHPGLVETEFSVVRFEGDLQKAASVYKGIDPLVAEDIAEAILFMATRKSHVNIADLLILPTAQASVSVVNRTVFSFEELD